MKIQIELNKDQLIELVAKEYAKALYKKYEGHFFGLNTEVEKIVKGKALKILEEDATISKTIEDLLKDKELVEKSVSRVIVGATEKIMRGGDYD